MVRSRMTTRVSAGTKKKILTNKALTKKVRSLSGQEGERLQTSNLLYSNVTLTSAAADINYFDDATLFISDEPTIQLYYDCHIKLLAAAQATVRIMYCFDEHFDGTNIIISEILNTVTHSASPLLTGVVANMKEAKHKNRAKDYRCVVVRDQIVALEAGVPKAFSIRYPLFGRKTNATGGVLFSSFFPFIMALADESDVTFSLGVTYWHTKLGN